MGGRLGACKGFLLVCFCQGMSLGYFYENLLWRMNGCELRSLYGVYGVP